ncbi:hypothetical protein BC835DRAFT_1307454 [Cytidiella melzeri]|nr:hypothetical protein BC835DRAFT_1307454 [Cytidiella melzeri]
MRSSTPIRRDYDAPSTPKSVGTSTASRSRIAKLIFDIRTLVQGDKEPEVVAIQPPHLPPWPPLSIEKRACCHDCPCHAMQKDSRKKNWRNRVLIYALIVILLYLLANSIILSVKVYGSPSTGLAATNGTSSGLSVDAQQCISQYTVNAPSDPLSYPCSSCLPVLQYSTAQLDSQDEQILENAVQFCGLRSVFETAGSDGQAALKNGKWAQDVKFCAWSGVSCDGSGKVSSLSLTFPGVPSILPNDLGALSGLQSFSIVGNGESPAGSLPSNFTTFASLTNLHLESTSLESLPDNLFSSMSKITTVTLIKNSQMGNALPSSITSSSLQNIVVNGQTLSNPLPSLTSSQTLQSSLKLLDLSSTSISGTITGSISALASLTELHLDSNNLSAPLPGSFPAALQILTISNNTQLSGPVSGSFCNLGSLQECNVQGTGLTAPATGCSLCQFSQTSTSG